MKTIGKKFGAGFVFRLLLLGVGAHISNTIAQTPGTFTPTGNMTTPRYGHSATLLPNGKVLIAGGLFEDIREADENCHCTASAELYDPSTRTFTATNNMTTPRRAHAATLLPNGKVLIAGGLSEANPEANQNCNCTASAELYDPSTETFTAAGNMTTTRIVFEATLLNNGKVLIAGGYDGLGFPVSAELYDPSTGTFTRTGDMTTGKALLSGTLLNDGRVLMNGWDVSGNRWTPGTTELYDPETGTFSPTGGTRPFQGLGPTTATLLTNGKVLVTFGEQEAQIGNRAALYDPSTGTFTATGNLTTPRAYSGATLLADGTVLFVPPRPPFYSSSIDLKAELYDPSAGTFSLTGTMNKMRGDHTATLLPDGEVLIAGGIALPPSDSDGIAELYHSPPFVPVTFDPGTVTLGGSFIARFSGTNLTASTYFDLRFRRPGSSIDEVAHDWQQGLSAPHMVESGFALGTWTVTGVRAHQNLDDHSGDFFPVSATLTVTPF